MVILKDYETLIRDTINKVNEEDPNWDWSIQSFSDNRVEIRWGYLDYCEEKDNCFSFYLSDDYDEDFDDYWLTCRDPKGEIIGGSFVTTAKDNKRSWQDSFEGAIVRLLNEIAYYAHSRY